MKFFLAILTFCFISASHCYEIELNENDLQNFHLPDSYKGLFSMFNKAKGNDHGVIKASLNEFIDKLFKKVDIFAVKHGLDPVKLPDVSHELLGANIILTEGSIHGISTVNRNNDSNITYSPETKDMHLRIPIDLNSIYFVYHFQVKMLYIIDIEGHLKGEISDFKANVGVGFSFVKDNAAIDFINTDGMGPITLTFDDKTIMAKVLNILTEFVTKILHPIIEAIIKQIIILVANTVVGTINDGINHFLHPNHTSIATFP